MISCHVEHGVVRNLAAGFVGFPDEVINVGQIAPLRRLVSFAKNCSGR
jgi:hypothetical protein